MREAEEAKLSYNNAKRIANCVVWLAKSEAEKTIFNRISVNESGIFRLAKQMDKTNQE